MKKVEALKTNHALVGEFVARFGVRLVVFFGSAAKGVKAPEDIDVAVVLSDPGRYESDIGLFAKFSNELARSLGVSADVLDITFVSSKTPPLLLYYIARDGQLIFGDRYAFNEFRLRAMRIFFDFKIVAQWLYSGLETSAIVRKIR